MEDYLVPRGVGQAEYIEKKSRFLSGQSFSLRRRRARSRTRSMGRTF